jgi:hypothetical protein
MDAHLTMFCSDHCAQMRFINQVLDDARRKREMRPPDIASGQREDNGADRPKAPSSRIVAIPALQAMRQIFKF